MNYQKYVKAQIKRQNYLSKEEIKKVNSLINTNEDFFDSNDAIVSGYGVSKLEDLIGELKQQLEVYYKKLYRKEINKEAKHKLNLSRGDNITFPLYDKIYTSEVESLNDFTVTVKISINDKLQSRYIRYENILDDRIEKNPNLLANKNKSSFKITDFEKYDCIKYNYKNAEYFGIIISSYYDYSNNKPRFIICYNFATSKKNIVKPENVISKIIINLPAFHKFNKVIYLSDNLKIKDAIITAVNDDKIECIDFQQTFNIFSKQVLFMESTFFDYDDTTIKTGDKITSFDYDDTTVKIGDEITGYYNHNIITGVVCDFVFKKPSICCKTKNGDVKYIDSYDIIKID